ncbi:zincin-like metallopeptidase domain-containing protein [Erythrobacter sp. LQ02-29]|uniref:ArdC family protein n=1 Tax=Erythrobacter sp. LQ02-29 TaxID=2920384 RepID=UPI001F4EEBFB|nr:zincin-like metallopeptidase domain-containing protein [Erythrobacter sp. LQ02-29]MCP9223902.1 zincin-like metallopeptidase domain-containing protein [Erythrobacter sp. LQ02-29]
MSNTKQTIHERVTETIIAAIEQGAGTFQMPWHQQAIGLRNIASGNAYRGVNVLTLWAVSMNRGYNGGAWGTFKQWKERGQFVRKGEKGAPIVFYKIIEGTDKETGEETKQVFARGSTVFHSSQIDGYEEEAPQAAPTTEIERIERAEAFAAATGALIEEGGQRACYQPATDLVRMPEIGLFTGTDTMPAQEAYYATLLHELTHWTGHKSRCNREIGTGRASYAFEELVAELGSAFLCAELGLSPAVREDHAAYMESWLKCLKEDSRAIFRASSLATKAVDYLNDLQPTEMRKAA